MEAQDFKVKNLFDDIFKDYKMWYSFRGDPLFVSECNTSVELTAKDTNVDNIYNLITQLELTEEQFMGLGYRLESIYVRINNFNEEIRLDKILFELAQNLYPENIAFCRVIFRLNKIRIFFKKNKIIKLFLNIKKFWQISIFFNENYLTLNLILKYIKTKKKN